MGCCSSENTQSEVSKNRDMMKGGGSHLLAKIGSFKKYRSSTGKLAKGGHTAGYDKVRTL